MNMHPMRRQDRQMDSEFALGVMRKAPYVTVGFTRPDGMPYCLPLSVVVADGETFYFHCAAEGKKLDCIRHQPQVSLSAVTECAPAMGGKGYFTLQYQSATAVGIAEIVTDNEEKIAALRLICERFLSAHMDQFELAISRSLERTVVVRIKLSEPPIGKRKEQSK